MWCYIKVYLPNNSKPEEISQLKLAMGHIQLLGRNHQLNNPMKCHNKQTTQCTPEFFPTQNYSIIVRVLPVCLHAVIY